ncbi:hypothetical protein RO07_22720 [Pandoraea pulmonicola]|uniref:Uncharacterized protein n=1 Tax=Pandoraea pulmonicola TaxID=93221 RepID=A0ABM5S489_PANPU|nr:hypothetical protein RO07_22720 [Pandoraea pulmonicola]
MEVKFSNREILSAMGIPFATHDNPFSPECQASNLGACSIANFIVDKGTEIGFFMALNGKAVKEVMEGQIREEVKHSIKSFKEGNDGKDAIDKIFSLMIPFYDQIIGGINDPGHQVEIGDIALDLIDVGLTLTAIGKIGVSTLRGGLANARATLAAGKGTLAAFRSFKESIKISSLARKVGGELLDFVSPPFTSFNLNRIKGGDLPLTELKKIKNPDGADVLRCKRGAFGNCGFNWRPSRVGPAPGRARYLDEIYKKVDVKFKDPYVTEAGLKKFIDSRADLELPDVVYRAQPRPGGGGVGGVSYKEVGFTGPAHATQDDVLVSAIIHTASETGVKAKAASLSGKQEVSMHFMTENRDRGYALFKINKPNGENPFRRIEGIIKYDGPRLVEEGKLTEEQLIDACYQVFITKEDEIFYVANFGKIPQNLVSEVQV